MYEEARAPPAKYFSVHVSHFGRFDRAIIISQGRIRIHITPLLLGSDHKVYFPRITHN